MTDFQEFERQDNKCLADFLKSKVNLWNAINLDPQAQNTEVPCQPFRVIENNTVETDRWVGSLRIASGDTFRIQPRIGWLRFYAMLELAYSLTLGATESSGGADNDKSADLLAIAWFSALQRGVKQHHGWPKFYVRREVHDAHTLKGQLDLNRQLTENLGQEHRIACIYDDLCFDHPVNHATQFVINHLQRQKLFPFKSNINNHKVQRNKLYRYHDNLNLLNVAIPENFPYTHTRWNRTNGGYRGSYEIGRRLAQGNGLSSGTSTLDDAIFIDAAEIWEMFLLDRLTKIAKVENCTVDSPRFSSKKYSCLMNYNGRQRGHFIPDFILRNSEGKKIAILDAKYRALPWDNNLYIPSSEEVTQMAIYSVIEVEDNKALPCALIYPRAESEDGAKGINTSAQVGMIGEASLNIPRNPLLSWWTINIDTIDNNNPHERWLEKIDNQLINVIRNYSPP